MKKNIENFKDRILKKEVVIAIIGLGYVGLPNLLNKAKQGYNIIGFDVDEKKINSLKNARTYISDVSDEDIETYLLKENISFTTNSKDLRKADVFFIDVPTPIDGLNNPDLTYIDSAVTAVLSNIQDTSLIILESTTYPGTTRDYIVSKLPEYDLSIDDILVAYSPERIDPNNKEFSIETTPRVIGGYRKVDAEIAELLFNVPVHITESLEVAEMAKILENTYRNVNISLINEFTQICDLLDIDVFSVIEAAGTKPFSFAKHYPSIKIGGHCIGVDPYYLNMVTQKYNYSAELITAALQLNNSMVEYAIKKIIDQLNEKDTTVKNSNILLIGASYKKDVGDVREAAIFPLYEELKKMKSNLTIVDDYVDTIKINGDIIQVENLDYDKIGDYDLTIILSDHSIYDFTKIYENSKLLFDTKNIINIEENNKYFKL